MPDHFPGPQLRYLIRCEAGWLGAIGFAAAARRLAVRDRWIGWDDETRACHLHRIVGLARFLIRPGVSCPDLATHVLGRVLRDLPARFESCFGYRPWLAESFVDILTHSGVSLKAGNWIRLGCTSGRGRQDQAAVKGYYRLIDQPEASAVTPEHILAPHRQRTVQRMRAQRMVLCVQEGTDLNFTSHPMTAGLGGSCPRAITARRCHAPGMVFADDGSHRQCGRG